jgi:hypothetical protein
MTLAMPTVLPTAGIVSFRGVVIFSCGLPALLPSRSAFAAVRDTNVVRQISMKRTTGA